MYKVLKDVVLGVKRIKKGTVLAENAITKKNADEAIKRGLIELIEKPKPKKTTAKKK